MRGSTTAYQMRNIGRIKGGKGYLIFEGQYSLSFEGQYSLSFEGQYNGVSRERERTSDLCLIIKRAAVFIRCSSEGIKQKALSLVIQCFFLLTLLWAVSVTPSQAHSSITASHLVVGGQRHSVNHLVHVADVNLDKVYTRLHFE